MSEETNTGWDEARLLGLIRERIEESAELEYKGAGALRSDQKAKEEITKDISSIANADGGTLIYGISEYRDKPREHLPEKIDPVDRLQFSREWLDQIISQIRPRIEGLRIVPVALSSGSNDVAYVVEIPKGTTAHQALTFHYHRRYNFEALRMLDHEIRDVMNRRKHPKFDISARIKLYPRNPANKKFGKLTFFADNNSDILARNVLLMVHAPVKIKAIPVSYIQDAVTFEETNDGGAFKLLFSNNLGSPLFPRTHFIMDFEFEYAFSFKVQATKPFSELYQYSFFADDMPVLKGVFKFEEIFDGKPAPPWVDVKPG